MNSINTVAPTQHTTSTFSDVKLADSIDAMVAQLKHYIDLSDGLAMVVTLWVVQTYCFEKFQFAGYLHAHSPLRRCGKTTLLDWISLFVCGNPSIETNPTAPNIFRRGPHVLLLDEL